MKWKPYPKYKDSGVEWLRDVPEGWGSSAIKHRCLKITDGAHVSPETDGGVFPFVSTVDLRRSGIDFENCLLTTAESYTMMACGGCKPELGDILFSKDGTIGKTVAVEDPREFVVASSLIIVRPNQRLVKPYFLNYLFQVDFVAAQVDRFVKGTALRRLSIQNLLFVKGLFPPIDEQLQITEFLDRQTRKIDTLIAKQERLIELLQEKRQALISHAVTKGLSPGAPMKPSGVEWLGDVPAHWAVTRLRRVADGGLINGLFKTRDSYGQGVPLVNVFDVYQRDFQIQPETLERVQATSAEMEKYRVVAGDLLFVRSSLKLEGIGVSALVRGVFEPTVFECHLVRLRPRRELVVPRFLSLYLSSMPVRHRLVAAAQTTTMTTIGQEGIACMEVLLPPKQEQVLLIDHLDLETRKHDEIVTKAQRSIALMREHRTALISAAVTGKIDVREPSHA
jgi:type I restriction enzyme, S subunit